MLETIITSKTRLNLLIKFFLNIANVGHLNSLASEFNESTNSVRKELNNLTEAGYLKKNLKSNKIVYSANSNHPLFNVLQKTVRTHVGIEDIMQRVIDKVGHIEKIILLGDYAKGIDSGTIDVLMVGKSINMKYLDDIRPKIEKKINRKINFLSSSTGFTQEGLVLFS